MNHQPAMEAKWWRTGVIYQIYPRSFQDTTGNGVGDLEGIISHLDYLKSDDENSLGIDAIWLSPVYPSPQVDFGYDVSDFTAIDPLFGDLSIFDHLLREAHRREIRVIMDLVFNHTSDQHPWFRESRSSLNNPRRDWYLWHPGRNGRPPNNWASYFGGPAWHRDLETGQYYLAMFHRSQPDLNWRNPAVRDELYAIMRFWLDRGVDGFRLDVYNQYFKDDQFRSNPRRLNPLGLIHKFWGQKHIYDRDRPEMFPVLREMRRLVDSYPGDRILLGETSDEGHFNNASRYYGQANDGLHLAYNFAFLNCRWRARNFRRAIRKWERDLPDWAWPTYVLSNHDVVHHASRYCRKDCDFGRLRIAAAMLLTLRGTPTLYYGEEIGQRDIRLTGDTVQDPPGRRYWPVYKGRDGCRAPMQWDNSPAAGFTSGDPWLPVHPEFHRCNLRAQQKDKNSLFQFYQRLIGLRRKSEALQIGRLVLSDNSPANILAYRRVHDQQVINIILNFSRRPQLFKLPDGRVNFVLLGTHRADTEIIRSERIELQGHEIIIACEGRECESRE